MSMHPVAFLVFVIPVLLLMGQAFGRGRAFRKGWQAADPKPLEEPRSP